MIPAMHILWHTLAVGPKANYHLEAQVLFLSILAHCRPGDRIRVGTDQCALYRWMEPLGLEIEEVSSTRIQQWIDGRPAGTAPFFFRAKLARCAELANAEPDFACAWIDTDCIAKADLSPINACLAAGSSVMHCAEDFYQAGNSKRERAYWKFLSSHTFAGVRARPDSRQWNSGVVIAPAGQGAKLSQALDALDDMMRIRPADHIMEQVAASLVLEQTGPLAGCQQQILHYWANRDKWAEFQLQVMLKLLATGGDTAKALQLWKDWPTTEFPAERRPRLSRKERWKRKIRKQLGLLAPSEK